jgi:hypothetical protein
MNAKIECEVLMNEMLPLGEKMLLQFSEFYPYAGYMKPDGEIVHVGAKEAGTDRAKSKDLIAILKRSFGNLARSNQCKATAIVYDVVIPLPDENRQSDAIQVCLDHADNYSAEFFLPYELIEGRVVYGEMFAQEGKYELFGKKDLGAGIKS